MLRQIDSRTSEILRKASEGLTYKRLFIKYNKIIGSILIGDNKQSSLLKSMIENKTDISNIHLSGISVDELIMKFKK